MERSFGTSSRYIMRKYRTWETLPHKLHECILELGRYCINFILLGMTGSCLGDRNEFLVEVLRMSAMFAEANL